jgi:hypothetical protein
MSGRFAVGREKEIGSHTPTGGTGLPIYADGRVATIRQSQCGWRWNLDVVRSRTESDGIQHGTRVVGLLALVGKAITPRPVGAPGGPGWLTRTCIGISTQRDDI